MEVRRLLELWMLIIENHACDQENTALSRNQVHDATAGKIPG
jgi:hypothetical protein